jgi:hypothetical protein
MLLKRGSKGEAVRALQRALVAAGFALEIDGDFGRKTEDAVKEFQRRKGLAVDGVVGPNTLQALEAAGGGGTVITFTPEETDAPPVVKGKVREYVELLARQHDTLLEKSQDALANFETTMVFASTSEANADLLGSMLSKAFDFAVDQMLGALAESNPVTAVSLGLAKTLFQAASDELERAGKAADSHAIGNWIKDQRGAIDRLRGRFDRDAVQSEMELGYLESSDQQAYFAGLADGITKLRSGVLPPVEELERQLYEQWINANFKGISDDAPGCIQVKVEADDGFDITSCTVETPSGDKVADALNRLFAKLPGALRPRDLRVRKRGCFYVENLVPGGKSWSCGWLDRDNQPIHNPVLPEASKAFRQPQWQFVEKFFTE